MTSETVNTTPTLPELPSGQEEAKPVVDDTAQKALEAAGVELAKIQTETKQQARVVGIDPATGVVMVGDEKGNLPYESGRRA